MKWLNYHHLYYFWKIAKHGSVVAASHELLTTQSSLSNQLKQLEESIGFNLFERVGKKLILSDQGRYIYKIADEIFTKGESLVSEIKNNQLGINRATIRVGAVSTLSKNIQHIFLSPLLKSIDRPFLKLVSSDRKSLLEQMKNYEIDFLITGSLNGLDLKGFQTHKIQSFQYCFVHKKSKKPTTLKEAIKEKGLVTPFLEGELEVNLELFLNKNKLTRDHLAACIEDTALLRLFAVNEDAVVLIPKIGVYRDLLNQSLEILGNLPNISETFYLISRSETFELLNLDIMISQFREIFQKGIYEN